jgi:2,3-bisphosphoglycerate-dependent phosphoglycerate mutase
LKQFKEEIMQLLLVRHAQSANNALPTELRVHDPGLTETGNLQAEHLADWLQTLPLTTLWCSPFRRSLDTTEAIRRRLSITPVVHSELFELGGCYSGYEAIGRKGEAGMGRSELLSNYPAYELDSTITDLGWWRNQPFESAADGAERARRVILWFQSELQQRSGAAAAIIHADFKRLLLQQMLHTNLPVERLGAILNASVTAVRWNGNAWRLDFFNSISHLPYELHTE